MWKHGFGLLTGFCPSWPWLEMDLLYSMSAKDSGFVPKINAFILSLAVADFCARLRAFPSLFLCKTSTRCDPKAFLGSGMDYLSWLFVYTSLKTYACLVLEPYVAVVKPLSYLTFMTRRRVFQVIFISRTIAVVVVLAFFTKLAYF